VSPNNPTGSFVGRDELPALAAFCGAHALPVISDEVFADYRFPSRPRELAGDAGGGGDGDGGDGEGAPTCLAAARELCDATLVLSLGGLSKACGLPQLKLGWIVAGGPAPLVEAALGRIELCADTYLSVGTPVQLALPRLLELGAEIRAAIAARVRDNRARLAGALAPGSPCTLLAAEGGWSAILRVPAVAAEPGAASSDEAWALALLRDDDLLVHPGYLYDMPPGAYLVLGLLPRPDLFAAGVARIIARCDRFVS